MIYEETVLKSGLNHELCEGCYKLPSCPLLRPPHVRSFRPKAAPRWALLTAFGRGQQNCLGNYSYFCVKVHNNALFHTKYIKNFLAKGMAPPQTPLPLGRGHPLPRPYSLEACSASTPRLPGYVPADKCHSNELNYFQTKHILQYVANNREPEYRIQ